MVALVRRHPSGVDALVAVAFCGVALISAHFFYTDVEAADPSYQSPSAVTIALAMAAVTLPLAGRRRFPLVTVVVVGAAFVVTRFSFDVYETLATVLASYLAIYSATLHGHSARRTPAVLGVLGLIAAEIVREIYFSGDRRGWPVKTFILGYNLAVLLLPWWLGAAMRQRLLRERDLVAQTATLERARTEDARRAVFDERVRIARELHDVVAHHVSVMGVQAGAARRIMHRRPEQAGEALGAIEVASRQAVAEMDRLLGFLRRDDEIDDRSPRPGLGQLDDLVAQVRAAGLDVDLAVEGEPVPLPSTLDVSAYRIVQEALTNTLKHAGATRASVRVCFGREVLDVQVVDDGPSGPVAAVADGWSGGGGGHGLVGMRERVGLHGGELRAGARLDRPGFAVHARLPRSGRGA